MDYEALWETGVYALGGEEKRALYAEWMTERTRGHRAACPPYDRLLTVLGIPRDAFFSEETVPMLPVALFKEENLQSVSKEAVFKVLTSSGTKGQRVSRIALDRETAAAQQMALSRIGADFWGAERLPMLVIDSPDVLKDRDKYSARGAAILGFSVFASRLFYALDKEQHLNLAVVRSFAERYAGQRVLIFGFTYLVWQCFYGELKENGLHLDLANAVLLHGGGWKNLEERAVSPETFRSGLKEVAGIRQVHNYYGMAEQTGCIYMECPCGHLHASVYSDVILRRPGDFRPCAVGEPGIVQVLTPLAASYPGHSILTEDEGVLLGEDDCPCGRLGKYFRITGRIPKAEIRGCSNCLASSAQEKRDKKETAFLVGAGEPSDEPWEVFEKPVLAFLADLSDAIRRDGTDAETAAFGFWCRRSRLQEWKRRYEDGNLRLGRGRILHIPASNVPLLFAYSLAMGLLAGNGCLVRLSPDGWEQDAALCRRMELLLQRPEHARMKERITVFSCAHDAPFLREQAAACDGCVVWGGDAAVSELRCLPMRADAVQLLFPDRFSACILDVPTLAALDFDALCALAHRFYNDSYQMDQNACSSPQYVIWNTGGTQEALSKVRKRWWEAVAAEAEAYPMTAHKAAEKYALLCRYAMTLPQGKETVRYSNRLFTLLLSDLPAKPEEVRGRFGLFFEAALPWQEALSRLAGRRLQTLTYFGVPRQELFACVAERHLHGVHRIVPVGQASQMEPVWDGQDVIAALSRLVSGG